MPLIDYSEGKCWYTIPGSKLRQVEEHSCGKMAEHYRVVGGMANAVVIPDFSAYMWLCEQHKKWLKSRGYTVTKVADLMRAPRPEISG